MPRSPEPPPAPSGPGLARWGRLARKELRETLRDRRTILTLVLMPLLVYPLLGVLFQRFLVSTPRADREVVYHVAVDSERAAHWLADMLRRGEALVQPAPPPRGAPPELHDHGELPIEWLLRDDVEAAVTDLEVDVGVRAYRLIDAGAVPGPGPPTEWELFYLDSSAYGRQAVEWIERRLRAVSEAALADQLRQAGVARNAATLRILRVPIEADGPPHGMALGAAVPLILILMTIVGAVYPAIDLTAGERERGTLETLIAAPVPRLGLLLAKYVAVMTVALLTAVVNLAAMAATIYSLGLEGLLFGERGLSPAVVGMVLALLVLFAVFFSAVLLAVTSFARSFKEAQAYLIPLMLVSIAPGMLAVVPGVRLQGVLVVTPLANIVLLARDLFEGTAEPLPAVVVVVSTALFALAAVMLAAHVFGTDALLYGSPGSWSDLFRRPRQPRDVPTLTSALVCLAAMFPAYFLLANLLARVGELPLGTHLALQTAVAALLFAGVPLAAAAWGRVRTRAGFFLKRPAWPAWPGAVLLSVSLWPFAYELVLLTARLGLVAFEREQLAWAEELLDRLRELSPVWVLLALAAAPAVVEEFFFRGYLLRALAARAGTVRGIVLSAVLFGLFHLVVRDALAPERLAPSTLLGLVLGWVCLRTGSLFPGIVLHAGHNGLLLMVSHYRDELTARGWGVEEATHLPPGWLLTAAAVAAAGAWLIRLSGRRRD